jgi:uncharacterized protein YegL
MKQTKTIYHLILDRSGSMIDCLENTINGFNEQIHRIRRIKAEFPDDEMTVGLTIFNEEVIIKYLASDPHDVSLLDSDSYKPGGSTALLDAIGFTVKRIESELERSNNIQDTSVIVVVITDGYENASKVFSMAEIKLMIARLEQTTKWTFAFVGATFDAVEVAKEMSIKSKNSYSFNKNEMDTVVWDKLNFSLFNYSQKKKNKEADDNLFGE